MDLEQRVRRIEDRAEISDLAVAYAVAIDEADWPGLAGLLTDPVHIDFSEAGMPAADLPRDQFAGFAAQGLEPWDARQHLSPNHRVAFEGEDRAVLHSYMYAQHYKKGQQYVMRGSYENHVVRTEAGWKIAKLVQHVSWLEGDPEPA